MGTIKQLSHHKQEQQRLALLALLADRPRPSGQCLSDATLAALVEGKLGKDEVEACLVHLAQCEQCMQLWLQLDQHRQGHRQQDREGKRLRFLSRPKVLTAAGSLLAVAASIAVFVTITTRMDQSLVIQQPLHQAPTTEAMQEEGSEQEKAMEPLPEPAASQQQVQGAPTTTRDRAEDGVFSSLQHELGEQRALERKKSAQKAGKASGSSSVGSGRSVLAQKAEIASGANSASRIQAPAQLDEAERAIQIDLDTWKEKLRAACEQSPATQLPARFARQGEQLLYGETLDPAQRVLVKKLLAHIARTGTPVESCRRILKLLDPPKPQQSVN